jgi:glutamate racemase
MLFTHKQNQAIGIFDSGLGGLTVMKEIINRLPQESVIYFGDTARVPYGEKSAEAITRYSIENAIFLMEHNIKVLVVACNTASAFALKKLQKIFSIPIVGVIEPGVERAISTTRNQNIAVLGTTGTIRSGVYQKEIENKMPNGQVISISCPLFVPLVEEKFFHHPATRLIIKEYLTPLKEQKVDTVLLGCTHYPLLKYLIMEELEKGIMIVDSASTCADKVAAILQTHQLFNELQQKPTHRYFVSDDPKKFQLLGQDFLGASIDYVESTSLNSSFFLTKNL